MSSHNHCLVLAFSNANSSNTSMLASHSLCFDATTLHRCSTTVFTYRCIMPSNCGCREVVHVLLTPRCYNTLCKRQDSKLRPWLMVRSLGSRKWQKKLAPGSSPPSTLWQFGVTVHTNHMVVALRKGSCHVAAISIGVLHQPFAYCLQFLRVCGYSLW
jgi:hypothetical protein